MALEKGMLNTDRVRIILWKKIPKKWNEVKWKEDRS